MKKLTLTLFAISAFTFFSCEVEPAGEDTLKSVGLTAEDCSVSVLPELPSVVNACTTAKGPDANGTYFDLTVNDSNLAGNYGAWCADVDLGLDANECFEALVFSSYDVLPEGAFENPDNFDLVNWILNQNFVGKASPSGGVYTFGDVQWAIWELIDNQNCIACSFLGSDWSTIKGQEIVDEAIANGEGYMPGAGESLGIVLLPKNRRQPVIITIPLECEPEPVCETAFARTDDGSNCFIGNGFNRWGWSIGPLAEGTEETYEIYAGAGQCDISKGTLVGTVDVSYVGGNVTVTYNIDEAFTVSETHTYAGNAMFPVDKKGKPTVAPGQFSIQTNLSGEIYVIAHADVCGQF
ncbi:hypothetical protein D2V93_09105 [Flagellimonas taeanensis]|uniref:hypothetical protein n=1 Tax=Flavobacteriaceae TaxID=49546 RepID=UPI000E6989A1|nr:MULTISPECIES: hypothetical protein [Allomuricauda]MDC6385705.1 hypothetical protein [Muricauda sp. SK9]RIV51004.1 hypothetical protein D2V93_09105 [Allomuricauda taeanensis]